MRSISLTVVDIIILSILIGIVTLGYLWHCAEEKAEELYTEAEETLDESDVYLLTILKQLGKVLAYALVILFVY